MKRILSAVLLLGSAGLWPTLALAMCEVNSNGVNFGTYEPLSTRHHHSDGLVTFSCEKLAGDNIAFEIKFNAGNSGSFLLRKMSSVGNTLDYNLHMDASYQTVWGDGNGEAVSYSSTLNFSGVDSGQIEKVSQSIPIYGRILSRQYVPAGRYSDTIAITVLY